MPNWWLLTRFKFLPGSATLTWTSPCSRSVWLLAKPSFQTLEEKRILLPSKWYHHWAPKLLIKQMIEYFLSSQGSNFPGASYLHDISSFLFVSFTAIVVFTFSDRLTFVSDFESLRKIQTKRLGAIRENVEGDLKRNSFLIQKKPSSKEGWITSERSRCILVMKRSRKVAVSTWKEICYIYNDCYSFRCKNWWVAWRIHPGQF